MFPLSFQKAYFKSNIHHGMTPSTWWDIQKVLTLFARLSLNGSTLIVICVSFERFIGNMILRDRIGGLFKIQAFLNLCDLDNIHRLELQV